MAPEPVAADSGSEFAKDASSQQENQGAGPRFSIVVPVYQQWSLVSCLLACLSRQAVSLDRFEIILVDNGSSDASLPEAMPANAHVFRCETPGSYAARNLGVENARGEVLVFTDADCLPAPDWLAAIDEAFRQRGSSVLLAGAIEVLGVADAPSAWEIYDTVKGIPQARYVAHGYGATANLAVPKAVFDAMGGFDSRRFSGGDADFCRRAGKAGHAIVYVANAHVRHPARTTWTEIATKARRVKGGQLSAGSPARRVMWTLRTLCPPVRGAWTFLRARQHPLVHRLVATGVLGRIWMVEISELFRLAFGRPPERR